MQEVTKTVYAAFDGKTFDTEQECRSYEREQAPMRLIGLTEEQIVSALNLDDRDLAEAVERAGYLIMSKRRERGELKRRREPKQSAQATALDGVTAGAPKGEDAPAAA